MGLALLDRRAQRRALAEQMGLADELLERRRARAHGERVPVGLPTRPAVVRSFFPCPRRSRRRGCPSSVSIAPQAGTRGRFRPLSSDAPRRLPIRGCRTPTFDDPRQSHTTASSEAGPAAMSASAAELLPGPGGGGLDFARSERRGRRAALRCSCSGGAFAGIASRWSRSGSSSCSILVAIAAPLVVNVLGLPGPVRAEPQPDERLRQPAGAEPRAPVRRRPARPGRDVAGHLRHARLARGGHHRHRASRR